MRRLPLSELGLERFPNPDSVDVLAELPGVCRTTKDGGRDSERLSPCDDRPFGHSENECSKERETCWCLRLSRRHGTLADGGLWLLHSHDEKGKEIRRRAATPAADDRQSAVRSPRSQGASGYRRAGFQVSQETPKTSCRPIRRATLTSSGRGTARLKRSVSRWG